VELLTTAEAARRIGLSPRSIRSLVVSGKLAAYFLGPNGGVIRFSPDDLEAYQKSTRKLGSRGSLRPKALDRPDSGKSKRKAGGK
jgi:excisionase family DNA binding protein